MPLYALSLRPHLWKEKLSRCPSRDHLPYYIDVYGNDNGSKASRLVLHLNLDTWTMFLERNPRLPRSSPSSIFDFNNDEGANGNESKSTSGHPKVGQIDLRNHQHLSSSRAT
ncbi:hypothetical protein B0F90DRAFT_1819112 [Multifurca ochricompacta]|uniref:Uncharacterized protein n=1 Tax=Multifurca ochricompacta TaxID=376703 RepID=A0AAD4QM16_9AGAM|nr:hypothetical protein B0F90DRAFT_1819112 [Multifurca ochricompacta]